MDSITMPFGDTYGPLNTGKILAYMSNLQCVRQGNAHGVSPVTAHLVPTLRCNHRCYFCTYGGAKGSVNPRGDKRPVADAQRRHDQVPDMPFQVLCRTLEQLAGAKVRGVIFTGGGEPTLYGKLPQAMARCKNLGMDCSLNTNGNMLTDLLIDQVLEAKPTYIRISLNAGTPEVQRLITGTDDFGNVLEKLRRLMLKVHLAKSETTVCVAFAVELINVFDMEVLVKKIDGISRALESEYHAKFPVTLLFRPVSNYESSKNYDEKRAMEIVSYLERRSEKRDARDFLRFMYSMEGLPRQTPKRILDLAVEILGNRVRYDLDKDDSTVKVYYPIRKFVDLPRVKTKPYPRCLALPWFLFIWPDGTVYPCVEWAGTPGFEMGNIRSTPLGDILGGHTRKQLFQTIDESVLHERCAPICAHHEINIFLDHISNGNDDLHTLWEKAGANLPPDSMHPSFL